MELSDADLEIAARAADCGSPMCSLAVLEAAPEADRASVIECLLGIFPEYPQKIVNGKGDLVAVAMRAAKSGRLFRE